MIPWEQIGRAKVPGGELVLSRRGDELAIRLHGIELMNSRSHQSEELLGSLGCAGLPRDARVLIGGLGMGFTLRAALDTLGPGARVTVAELVPEVVEWNRGPLAHLARQPLDDPRVTLVVTDVAAQISKGPYHAILLDVDNGPDAFTTEANGKLYSLPGLLRARRAVIDGGRFGVWSVEPDKAFTGRLQACGFDPEVHRVPPRPGSGTKHVVWIAHARTPKIEHGPPGTPRALRPPPPRAPAKRSWGKRPKTR